LIGLRIKARSINFKNQATHRSWANDGNISLMGFGDEKARQVLGNTLSYDGNRPDLKEYVLK
jgi:hypothetical protein